MSNREFSDADLRRLTNIEDLLGKPTPTKAEVPPPPSMGEKIPGPPEVGIRSTTDPLQINFASADMAGALQKPTTKPFVKVFAWTFLAGPFMAYALMMLYNLLTNIPDDPSPAQIVARVGGLLLSVAIGGFWPYVLTRRG